MTETTKGTFADLDMEHAAYLTLLHKCHFQVMDYICDKYDTTIEAIAKEAFDGETTFVSNDQIKERIALIEEALPLVLKESATLEDHQTVVEIEMRIQ